MPRHWISVLAVAAASVVALALAAPAGASDGTWDRAWGKNVNGGGVFGICTAASSCLAGTTGGLGGEMNLPYGITTDSAGKLYVTEFINNRVQKFADPAAGGGGAAIAPSSAFTIAGLNGRKLKLKVTSFGTAEVTDAGARAAGARAIAAAKRLLTTSTASGGPGIIVIPLKLTKAAKQKLRQKGKVKVNARITFTPNGGTARSQTTKLKIKKK